MFLFGEKSRSVILKKGIKSKIFFKVDGLVILYYFRKWVYSVVGLDVVYIIRLVWF